MNLSDQDLDTALLNAHTAGDVAAATAFAQERRKRRSSATNADWAASMRVPEPQGFMEDSGINAFGRAVRENIGGAAGSALGGAGGLKLGASIGTAFGPIGTAVGGGIGMLGGSLAGAMFGGEVQQAVAPTSEDTLRILEADAQKSPFMSAAGNMLPYVAQLKMSPRALGTAFTKITPQMTAAETSAIVGNRVGTAVGAGLGGISEAVVPMISGQEVKPENVVLGTLLGGLFNEPNRIGRAMGLPSTPTLSQVRASQAAAAMPPPASAETRMVVAPPQPREINIDAIIGPRAVDFPEQPAPDPYFAIRPPVTIETPTPMALPEASPNDVQASLRREQAIEVQQQIERLKARRDDMVKRGVDPKAIKQIEAQLKAREKSMMGLEFDTTIIAKPPEASGPSIIESNARAMPPQSRQIVPEIVPEVAPVARQVGPAEQSADAIIQAQLADDAAAQSPAAALALRESLAANAAREVPVDPRMAARASGEDVVGRGERPALMSADAITQAQLADDAVVQSPVGAAGLREQLAAREAASNERVEIIPEDYARARQNAAKGGPEWERIQANNEPAAAFRKADGELKLYDGHHRLVSAQQEGKATIPVKIDGEGTVEIPVSAFAEKAPIPEKVPAPATEAPPVTKAPANTPEPTPASVETPEVISLRKQIEKLDEDIFNAKADGDEYGAKGLELARRRVQDRLTEAMNPSPPKSLADQIRSKKVAPGSRGQLSLPLLGLSDAQMRAAWNGALEIAARAVEAGASIAKGAKAAIEYVRKNFPQARFKDDEFTRAVEADLVSGMGAARRAGEKEAAQASAAEMDLNPDKFFASADSTPVQTFMDDVDKTMRNAKRDVMSGRTSKGVWQHIKDLNRSFQRGNQAALNDLAKGGGGTGRASPALDKLNTSINGTRPGAQGKGERGIWDDTMTNLAASNNELAEAYNGISPIINNLGTVEQEALLENLVKWMQDPASTAKLKNQPAVLKAVETLRKITRGLYDKMKANGIDVGDAGPNYFSRLLDTDVVRRNYDEFVDFMTKVYDMQWKQNDPKYVTDLAKARESAKSYADSAILGHEGIALDGSDLNLGAQRSGDPNFLKARTFTGAASDFLDANGAKFYKRNPFEVLSQQINRVERRIGLARAFGKIVKENGKDVLDPTAKWREFVDAAVKEGNESIINEVRERYQMMFGIGGKFDSSTQAFQQAVRNLGYYSYLSFSGISSLAEPNVIAMRLNKPVSGLFQSYGKTFRSIARQIKNMPLDYKEKLADRLGLAENATMRMSMHLGKADEQGVMSSKGVSKFMFLTGNSVISNAVSNASVDIGMTALRTSLLDFEYGREANGARIWLEELGVKKADFDRVSKWLEGQANDEARFNNVMGNSEEAAIVREALRKFTREARSKPDAGTKNQYSSTSIGSMLLSLQSYLYDFTDKVLGRNWRQLKTGFAGKTTFDGDVDPTQLTPQERVRLMAPMMLGMPSLIAANYGIALMRETLYPDPEKIRRDRERTAGEVNWNRLQRAFTRSNALGPYDMLYNLFTQARYERDVAAASLGPYMGGVLELAKSAIALNEERNSGNTNTAERKAARNFWNVGPKPLINMALSSLPGGRLAPVAAAGIQLGSQRAVAEGFVDTVAGRPTAETKKKPKPAP